MARRSGLFNPIAQSVVAEQFTAAKTAMTIVTLVSTMTDYTVIPAVKSGNVQSTSNAAKSYTMRDTDWVVVGPNLEVVYTNARFTALYTAVPGNAMSFAVGPVASNPMSVQLLAYIAGAIGTLDIDWGDGSAHATPAVAIGTNPVITHVYTSANVYYPITVVYKVGGTTVNTAIATFQALPPSAFKNDIDMSTTSAATGFGNAPSTIGPQSLEMESMSAGSMAEMGMSNLYSDMNSPMQSRVISSPREAQGSSGGGVMGAGEGNGTTGTYTDAEMAAIQSSKSITNQPLPVTGTPDSSPS